MLTFCIDLRITLYIQKGDFIMIKKNKVLISIFTLLMIVSLSACGSKSASSTTATSGNQSQKFALQDTTKYNADQSLGNSTADSKTKNDGATSTASTAEAPKVTDASKIVKTYTLQMQTLKFDNAITSISNKCTAIGGYVETSNISGTDVNADNTLANRTATLKLRIPKEQYVNFKAFFKGLGNIVSQQETGENITQQYFDTDAHLTSLKIQEARLLELLKKSGDLKSILEIEKELETVRYSIESLTTSLKKMDNLVDYTTFSISINEVQKISNATVKPVSLIAKIADGFKSSIKLLVDIFKNLLIIIAYILPFAIIALIAYPIVLYIYKNIKKRQEKTVATILEPEKEKDE